MLAAMKAALTAALTVGLWGFQTDAESVDQLADLMVAQTAECSAV